MLELRAEEIFPEWPIFQESLSRFDGAGYPVGSQRPWARGRNEGTRIRYSRTLRTRSPRHCLSGMPPRPPFEATIRTLVFQEVLWKYMQADLRDRAWVTSFSAIFSPPSLILA